MTINGNQASLSGIAKRFPLYLIVTFAILFSVYLLRGRSLERSATEALVWGSITAIFLVATKMWKARKGAKADCIVCDDGPGEPAT